MLDPSGHDRAEAVRISSNGRATKFEPSPGKLLKSVTEFRSIRTAPSDPIAHPVDLRPRAVLDQARDRASAPVLQGYEIGEIPQSKAADRLTSLLWSQCICERGEEARPFDVGARPGGTGPWPGGSTGLVALNSDKAGRAPTLLP